MQTTYSELEVLNRAYNTALENIDVYTEGIDLFKPIEMAYKITREYIDGFSNLMRLKEESHYIDQAITAIMKLNKIPEFRNKKYRIFVSRSYIGKNPMNIDLKHITIKEERLIAQNMARAILSRNKTQVNDIMSAFYNKYGEKGECFYLLYGDDLERFLKIFYQNYQTYIIMFKKMLKDVSFMIKNAKDLDYSIVDDFKLFCKGIQKAIVRRYEILVSNHYAIRFGVTKSIKDTIKKYSGTVKEINLFWDGDPNKGFKELRKTSKHIDDIKIGDVTFAVYKAPYSDVCTCISRENKSILVGDNFFELSPPVQEAVLLHEMGHYYRGHFKGVGLQNERKFEKFIAKKRKELIKYLHQEGYKFNSDKAINDTLVGIIHELDADTYAANAIGKKLVRDALKEKNLSDIANRKDMTEIDKKMTYLLLRVRAKMIK